MKISKLVITLPLMFVAGRMAGTRKIRVIIEDAQKKKGGFAKTGTQSRHLIIDMQKIADLLD